MFQKNRYEFVRPAVLSLVLSMASFGVAAAPLDFSDIYVFGDSLSDTGNTKSSLGLLGDPLSTFAGYGPNGRFSNGDVWHEYLAGGLGLPSASNSLDGGNNYAYGGARVDNAVGPSTGLLTQDTQYFDNQAGAPSDSNALFIGWAGGNDMRDLVGNTDPLADINTQLDSWVGMLGGLLDSGAETLLVPNLPDLGSIPEFRTTGDSASGTEVSMLWNTGLEQRLDELNNTTSADIFYFDVFGLFNDLLTDPAAFGFTDTTSECRSVFLEVFELSCANADTTVFWDEVHPTTAAHEYLGLQALNLLESGNALAKVPEPHTAVLMLMGLLAIWGRRFSPASRANSV